MKYCTSQKDTISLKVSSLPHNCNLSFTFNVFSKYFPTEITILILKPKTCELKPDLIFIP